MPGVAAEKEDSWAHWKPLLLARSCGFMLNGQTGWERRAEPTGPTDDLQRSQSLEPILPGLIRTRWAGRLDPMAALVHMISSKNVATNRECRQVIR